MIDTVKMKQALLVFLLCIQLFSGSYTQTAEVNIAQCQPTWQSSTLVPSDRAVDGKRYSKFSDGSCTHTATEVNPWWAVDLGRPTNVRKVVFYNRQDCCAERANDFIVGLTNVSPNVTSPTVGSYALCGQHAGAVGAVATVNCSAVSPAARYVIAQLNRTEILTICELEVYDYELRRCVNWTERPGVNYQGGAERGLLNLTACQQLCVSESNCVAIEYTPGHGWSTTCWTFTQLGGISPANGPHYDLSRTVCPETTTSTTPTTTSITPTTTKPTTIPSTTSAATTSTASSKAAVSTAVLNNTVVPSAPGISSSTTYSSSSQSTHSPVISSSSGTSSGGGGPAAAGNSSSKTGAVGGVVGGVGGFIVLVLIALLVVFLYRRRKRGNGKTPVGGFDPEYVGLQVETNRKPIKLSALQAFVDELSATKDGFKHEFSKLPKEDISRCSAGKMAKNKEKNRFLNILPYDETRVKLPVMVDAAEEADYVNASYIKKYNSNTIGYIATQGPKVKTLDDFWRIVWHEQVNVVVMITLLVENGKKKCEQYWPSNVNTSSQYGEITVTLTQSDEFSDFTQRTMTVLHSDGGERTVTQFHFRLFPDKGVPSSIYPLLAFRRKVRSFDHDSTGPLLVHCSAGVGRTGTFIALDMLLEQAKEKGEVDVFGVVQQLRQQRMFMVQVEDQHALLYYALLDAIKTGETSVPKSELEATHATLTRQYSKRKSSKLSNQYDLLNELKNLAAVGPDATGLQQSNKSKNRRSTFAPGDNVRVFLSSANSHESDYINAALAKGYHTPRCYILTQVPLNNTVNDFWEMIVNERCLSVVLLDSMDGENNAVEFWPRVVGSQLTCGSTVVSLLSSNQIGQNKTITINAIKLTNKILQTPLTVHLFELTSWPKGQEVPSSVDDLLELIHLVSSREQQLTNPTDTQEQSPRPVTVQCLDGASRSGVYCAASYIVDKMKYDNDVDVLLTCRYVINARPQAITSQEQYDFLVEVALKSLKWKPSQELTNYSPSPVYANVSNDDDTYANAAAMTSNLAHKMSSPNEALYANCEP